MIGFSSYDDWKTTPPPEEGNPSLCSRCDAWSEWDGPVCPHCGWGEPDKPDEWDEGNALPEEGR